MKLKDRIIQCLFTAMIISLASASGIEACDGVPIEAVCFHVFIMLGCIVAIITVWSAK